MIPRFLTVAKYELKQYRSSKADEFVILLVVLASFLMLVTPEVQQSALPSSHKIYRVGYLEGSVLGTIDSYTIDFVPFEDKYDMMYASNMDTIDAFAIMGRENIAVFGSGTRKSEAALSHLNDLMTRFNTQLVFDYTESDPSLSGILLPIRIDIVTEEIDYTSAINGSIQAKRRQNLGMNMLVDKAIDDGGSIDDEDITRSDPVQRSEDVGSGYDDDVPSQTTVELSLPGELDVEFPFKTLYKNMTLLSPLLMLSILLSLSLSRERVDRNIENLFMAPIHRWEILLGKSFPYLVPMLALCAAYGLQASMSFEAVKVAIVFAALSLSMLSFSLFSVVISRSYRELTFIGSFSLFAFFFFIVLPNVFSGVNVLAFISPLDTVTSIENGAQIPFSDIALSLLPYVFMIAFFTTFAGICFNPEILFSSHDFSGLLSYFYGTLAKILKNPNVYVIVAVALLVPFIFIVESILAYLVLPMGFFAPIMSLVLLAIVEEVTKIIPFYYLRMNPLKYGMISGAAFFFCEKLFNLYLVMKVYSYLGGPYMYFFKKMAPTLGLHIVSTTIFAALLYSSKRRIWFLIGLFVSVIMHVIYNVMVMRGLI